MPRPMDSQGVVAATSCPEPVGLNTLLLHAATPQPGGLLSRPAPHRPLTSLYTPRAMLSWPALTHTLSSEL